MWIEMNTTTSKQGLSNLRGLASLFCNERIEEHIQSDKPGDDRRVRTASKEFSSRFWRSSRRVGGAESKNLSDLISDVQRPMPEACTWKQDTHPTQHSRGGPHCGSRSYKFNLDATNLAQSTSLLPHLIMRSKTVWNQGGALFAQW